MVDGCGYLMDTIGYWDINGYFETASGLVG
jgi:hypothetical protein